MSKTKVATKKRRRAAPAVDWQRMTDDELLDMRIRDFRLHIKGSCLEPRINQLYDELAARGIAFRPQTYLADEWFCPDNVPVIGIPFCLAHPRLQAIEQRMMLEVEGGTEASCMRLLRHECGHAINYAHRIYRLTRWRELFGPFSQRYSNAYESQPYSRRYVVHLADQYAQSHPDEDFAETFAVWLAPDSRWQERYKGWPAMKKLLYVDKLMKRLGPRSQVNERSEMPYAATRMTSTLRAHYQKRRKHLGDGFPGYYDECLLRLFSRSPDGKELKAARFLRRHRRHLVSSVTSWTGQRKYDTNELIQKLVRRCEALELYVSRDEADMLLQTSAFVTAVVNRLLAPVHREDHR